MPELYRTHSQSNRYFLSEGVQMPASALLEEVQEGFIGIAAKSRALADLFNEIGETRQSSYLHQASNLLVDLATIEEALRKLATIAVKA